MTLFERALHVIEDFRPFHSQFQIDNVIIGPSEFGDDSDESAFGAFLQIQREVQARLSSLSAQRTDVHRMQLELVKCVGEASRWFCFTRKQKLLKQIAQSEEVRLAFEIEQMERATADVARELALFVERGERLASRVRAWSAQDREEIELTWWVRRFERRLIAGSLYGRPSSETIEALADMPLAFRQRLVQISQSGRSSLGAPRVVEILRQLNPERAHDNDHRNNPLRAAACEFGGSDKNPRLPGSLPSTAMAY